MCVGGGVPESTTASYIMQEVCSQIQTRLHPDIDSQAFRHQQNKSHDRLVIILLLACPPHPRQTVSFLPSDRVVWFFLWCHRDEGNLLNAENPTCCGRLCTLTSRLMILHAGMTMTEGPAISNYWSGQPLLIFQHWQLKSIADAIKNICFPLLSSLSPACVPSGCGMINVQGQNHTPLVS